MANGGEYGSEKGRERARPAAHAVADVHHEVRQVRPGMICADSSPSRKSSSLIQLRSAHDALPDACLLAAAEARRQRNRADHERKLHQLDAGSGGASAAVLFKRKEGAVGPGCVVFAGQDVDVDVFGVLVGRQDARPQLEAGLRLRPSLSATFWMPSTSARQICTSPTPRSSSVASQRLGMMTTCVCPLLARRIDAMGECEDLVVLVDDVVGVRARVRSSQAAERVLRVGLRPTPGCGRG